MENATARNRIVKRVVAVVIILLCACIVLSMIIGGYYLVSNWININKIHDLKRNVSVGEPGSIYLASASDRPECIDGQSVQLDSTASWSKKNFKAFGYEYSGICGSYRYDSDGELVHTIGVETEFKTVPNVTLIASTVSEDGMFKQLQLADESKRSENEAGRLAESLAEQLLTDLSDYELSVTEETSVRQRRAIGYIYSKRDGDIRLEDYVEIWFAISKEETGTYYQLLEINYDNDHRRNSPEIDSESVYQYVSEKVNESSVERYKKQTRRETAERVNSIKPYDFSIHEDIKGNYFIRCFAEISWQKSYDVFRIDRYEYIVYLPE